MPTESSPVARHLTVGVIGLSLVLRLGLAAFCPTNMDEGYHYLYTVYPSWSYFDHPPMLGLLAGIGLVACGGYVCPFSLRLGFALLFAAASWVLARWTARRFGDRAALQAVVWWNLAPFFVLGAGGHAVADGPLVFFALLTAVALERALVDEPGRTRPWAWVGLAWGGALLSKYQAVFLPAGAVLYVLAVPAARRILLTPGPYLAVLLGLAVFSPVLYWNATHEWASFAFQGDRAVVAEFRPDRLAAMLLGQMVYTAPGIWIVLMAVLVVSLAKWPRLGERDRLAVCLAAVPVGFFLVVGCLRGAAAHWALIGFVPLFPQLGRWCAGWAARWPKLMWGAAIAWGLALTAGAYGFAWHARYGLLPWFTPDNDPARSHSGWASLAEELDARGLVGRPNTFLFTSAWHESGQLAFAVGGRSPVACYNTGDARGFAYWTRPEDWLGRDGILITFDDRPWEPADFAPYFTRIEFVDRFPMRRGGEPFRPVRVYRCANQVKPFPYNVPSRD